MISVSAGEMICFANTATINGESPRSMQQSLYATDIPLSSDSLGFFYISDAKSTIAFFQFLTSPMRCVDNQVMRLLG